MSHVRSELGEKGARRVVDFGLAVSFPSLPPRCCWLHGEGLEAVGYGCDCLPTKGSPRRSRAAQALPSKWRSRWMWPAVPGLSLADACDRGVSEGAGVLEGMAERDGESMQVDGVEIEDYLLRPEAICVKQ